ncbi:hypothetical protein BJ741DRAFT_600599 [Chytriomyces cf. hyalinus JEL632]|nr:hypothetical protein BJ741DRAFT_600599 [Chytriomyces cf. hyalinus JEL632]
MLAPTDLKQWGCFSGLSTHSLPTPTARPHQTGMRENQMLLDRHQYDQLQHNEYYHPQMLSRRHLQSHYPDPMPEAVFQTQLYNNAYMNSGARSMMEPAHSWNQANHANAENDLEVNRSFRSRQPSLCSNLSTPPPSRRNSQDTLRDLHPLNSSHPVDATSSAMGAGQGMTPLLAIELAKAQNLFSKHKKQKDSIPHAGYVCRLCSIEGHWMQNCILYKSHKQPQYCNFARAISMNIITQDFLEALPAAKTRATPSVAKTVYHISS